MIMSEMQEAAETLQEVGWAVSVFGSARIKPENRFYHLAEELGARLAKAGLPLIAGGGPGIMEAANKGAFQAGGQSIGLNIKLPKEKSDNRYQTHSLHFDYFYSRKATFFMHSVAYVVLPGGFGTLDELFEVMTLVQTNKVPPAPIILIGSEYWQGLMAWMKEQLLTHKLIGSYDLELVKICDDIDSAMQVIEAFCAEHAETFTKPATLPG